MTEQWQKDAVNQALTDFHIAQMKLIANNYGSPTTQTPMTAPESSSSSSSFRSLRGPVFVERESSLSREWIEKDLLNCWTDNILNGLARIKKHLGCPCEPLQPVHKSNDWDASYKQELANIQERINFRLQELSDYLGYPDFEDVCDFTSLPLLNEYQVDKAFQAVMNKIISGLSKLMSGIGQIR